MSELHETIMGRKFFMSDFPSLVKNVERVAAALEVQNKAAEEKANPKEKAFPAILIHSTCPLHADGTTHTGAYRSKIVVEKFDNYLAAQNVMDEELRMVFGWEKLPDEPLTTNYDIGGLEAWTLHNDVSHSWKIVVVEVEVPKKEAG